MIPKTKFSRPLYQHLTIIAKIAKSFGLQPYLVGGIVRDLLLAIRSQQDCDITVTGGSVAPLAERLAKLWKAKLDSYPQFLTFTLRFKDGTHLDLITARREIYRHPGALPDVSPGTLETDLYRRDFSINAIAISLSEEDWGESVDLYHGYEDLKNKKIRVLHPKSFQDDPTRIFRAARFSARFGFPLEKQTERLLNQAVKGEFIKTISGDRMRTEFEKIFKEKRTAPVFEKLMEWGIFRDDFGFRPPISRGGRNPKSEILADLQIYDRLKPKSAEVGFCFWLLRLPVNDCQSILRTLNLSKNVSDRVLQCNQLYHAFAEQKPAETIPRMTLYPETILVFNAWVKGQTNRQYKKAWVTYQRWVQTKPLLNGEDLKKMGYPPGPQFRQILDQLILERFKGRLRSKHDEVRFVKQTFSKFDNARRA